MSTIEKNLELLKKSSSNQCLKSAIKQLFPKNKSEVINSFLILFISIIISYHIGFSINTVTLTKKITDMFLNVELAVFAIVFTGFIFFEGIVTDDVLKTLACNEKNGKTYLQIHYEYFTNFVFLNIFMLFINVVINIIILCMKKDYIFFSLNIVNNIVAFMLLIIFNYANLFILYELKSFIFNLFQIYPISKIEKLKKMIEEQKIKIDE